MVESLLCLGRGKGELVATSFGDHQDLRYGPTLHPYHARDSGVLGTGTR